MKTKNMAPVNPQLPDSLGQTTMALSTSVVLASDYVMPITLTLDKDTGAVESETLRVTIGTDDPVFADVQASIDEIVTRTPTLGQHAIATSRSVVLATSHPDINVAVQSSALPTGAATEASLATAAASLGNIETTSASSDAALTSIEANTASSDAKLTAISTNTTDTVAMLSTVDGSVNYGNSLLGSIDTSSTVQSTMLADINGKLVQGGGFASAALLTVIATDQPALPAAQSGTWTVSVDNAVAPGYVPVLTTGIVHSTLVTTAAYTTLIDPLPADACRFHIFDSSGSAFYFAVGGAGSEAVYAAIPPGGMDLDVNVAAGSRISVKCIDTNATSGRLLVTVLGRA